MFGKRAATVVTGVLALVGIAVSQAPTVASEDAPATAPATAPVAQANTVAQRAATAADGEVVDLPVSFTVRNVNNTRSQCSVDGETYTIRGHLTAPAEVLAQPDPEITLYVHGTNTGEWIWRLGVDGHNYTQELAARGHASVTIDRLGYGSSDIPDGFASCSGAHAEHAHQIVQQLRSGDYTVTGGEPTAFSRVYLAGHSSGALVAETVAVSYPDDVDGIILTGWAAIGLTGETNRRFLGAYERCLNGGEPKNEPGDPAGYVYFDGTPEDFLAGGLSPDADPRVVEAIEPLQPRNPCGVMVSEPMGILQDLELVDDIEVPVYLVFGEKDVLRQGVQSYPGLFTSSGDVTDLTVPDAGHFLPLDINAPMLFDGVAGWLDKHR
ncbi:alpha/beta hydrolase [Allostreptomyces psammosilenae]|uniref:Pimeloyl-ACP methyl ester carboxylesterase n=1 Tax=Allostreptomyces psammosilenae TaxID=1892865 RepID=A0A852ZLR9_9ACTN|nr:alpha/beta hydrolase [Allostreptomyces psammosilenae]NYI03346.1 pimeloyl-ACP methyl ester carboxylesterase [Allostreptomyces psammosilenae]